MACFLGRLHACCTSMRLLYARMPRPCTPWYCGAYLIPEVLLDQLHLFRKGRAVGRRRHKGAQVKAGQQGGELAAAGARRGGGSWFRGERRPTYIQLRS